MKVYTYSEARRWFARVLDEARQGGEVRIRRRDGTQFSLRPVRDDASPLDVPGVDSAVSLGDIASAIRDGRERVREPGPPGYSAGTTPRGAPGTSLLDHAGGLSAADAEEMRRVIEEDCERVNPDGW